MSAISHVVDSIGTLAFNININNDIRDEALRLATGVAPRIGRAGWAWVQAKDLLAQAAANLEEARSAAFREAQARAKAEKAEREAEAREALEEAGREAGGFCLVDTGRTGHGGHWPHWAVTPGAGGWASLNEAEAEAEARNQRVAARWAEYIS